MTQNKLLHRLLLIMLVIFCNSVSSQDEHSFTIVYNNIESNQELISDWGFAVWIESDDDVILFDTGTKSMYFFTI